jgi:26S proteasome regulatory subunit N6
MDVDHEEPLDLLRSEFDHAQEVAATDPLAAVDLFRKIVFNELEGEDAMKLKEKSIVSVGKLHAKRGDAGAIDALLKELRPMFADVSKAKAAKLVRTLIDAVSLVPDSVDLQVAMCKDSIEWTIAEKRTFLRHRLQTKLCELYRQQKEYQPAIELINDLVTEMKRLDDKNLLIEIQIIESRVYYEVHNIPKSKGSLTGARAAANSTYCPPLLQAEIDFLGGMLCAEERDFKTSYSYFYEAFETYNIHDGEERHATLCLKNMLLCKIMLGMKDDVNGILNGKHSLKHAGVELEAMRAIANASKDRSLKAFEEANRDFETQLKGDLFINSHLKDLYNKLLEENLCRIIEPYSKVEIAHVAQLIDLPLDIIHKKLSQMILDKKFKGILDQGNGCLVVFEDRPEDKTYANAVQSIINMDKVVEALSEKAGAKLN